MKKVFFLFFVLTGLLEAKTGAFLDLGTLSKIHMDDSAKREYQQNIPKTVAIGYIFDFNKYLGMGLQSGCSNFAQKEIFLRDKKYPIRRWSIDFLWNPVVFNLGKFRVITKLGMSRDYMKIAIDNESIMGKWILVPIRGVGLEIPLFGSCSLTGIYLNEFKKILMC